MVCSRSSGLIESSFADWNAGSELKSEGGMPMREDILENIRNTDDEDIKDYLWYLLENCDFAEDYEE